jgi:hypothetical protein
MKRCPQCEFIYEDHQSVCDMDGQDLLHDHALAVLPPHTTSAIKSAKRSSLNGIALPAGAGLLLAVAIFIGYTASPSSLQTKTEGATAKPATQQLEAISRQSDLFMQSTGSVSAVEPGTLEPSESETIANPETEVLNKTVHAHIRKSDERFPIARSVPPLPRLRPLPRLPEAKPLEKKPGSTGTGRTSQRSAQPKTESVSGATIKKDSKLGSFLKKTRRVLSKPFRSN